MPNVTVMGTGGKAVELCFDSDETTSLARQLAGAITNGVLGGSIIPASDKSGSPPPVPSGKNGEFIQYKSGTLALPNGYTALVEKASSALVFGNSMHGQMILSGTETDLTFVSAGGSGTVVAAGDHNRISLSSKGTGNWMIATDEGDDIISALGSGQHTVSAGEGRNAVLLGNGSAVVTSVGDDTVSMAGAAATIDATQGGNTLVYGGAGDLFFVGGEGGATIYGGAGSVTYYGGMHDSDGRGHDDDDDDDDDRKGRGRGHDDDHRGKSGKGGKGGNDCDDDDDDRGRDAQIVHGGSGGGNYLFAGSGAATLFGGGHGDELYAYGEVGQMLVGSAGAATLSAAFNWGDNTIKGGAGDEVMVGGTGEDRIITGRGDDIVFATDGERDVFVFVRNEAGGSALIQNIYDARDVRIDLIDYGCREEDYALRNQSTDGASVTVHLSDGTEITFENITQLTGRNFI